jgi:deoxyhypusine synthase
MEFDFRKRKKYLKKTVRPVQVKRTARVSELVEGMRETAFQGKNLAIAVDVWEEMLKKKATVFFGLAGAMVPAGMREIIVYLIRKRYIDCLVSTGANLFHDIHETLGSFHWQAHHNLDDNDLRAAGLDRIYDVLALEEEFNDADKYIYDFARTLPKRPYTTREFLYSLGKDLSKKGQKDGILTAAYASGVHVYCPAVADSSIGIALALEDGPGHFIFDIIGDVKETASIAAKARESGVVYVGGGTPKNFIQQAEVTADLMCRKVKGHKYAVQITADAPHWGGLSGCTFEEAQSWGKIAKRSRHVTVNSDATIALPIIVTALAERMKGVKRRGLKMDIGSCYRVEKRLWD